MKLACQTVIRWILTCIVTLSAFSQVCRINIFKCFIERNPVFKACWGMLKCNSSNSFILKWLFFYFNLYRESEVNCINFHSQFWIRVAAVCSTCSQLSGAVRNGRGKRDKVHAHFWTLIFALIFCLMCLNTLHSKVCLHHLKCLTWTIPTRFCHSKRVHAALLKWTF